MAQQATLRGNRKERKGVAVRDAKDKTVVVQVERVLQHPTYGKVIHTFKKFHVHDENNQTRKGDQVRIVECRPVSKLKRWRLVEILKRQVFDESAEGSYDTDENKA